MLEKSNSVTRAVSLSQSVLVAISARQGKVITTELLDGMTQKYIEPYNYVEYICSW